MSESHLERLERELSEEARIYVDKDRLRGLRTALENIVEMATIDAYASWDDVARYAREVLARDSRAANEGS